MGSELKTAGDPKPGIEKPRSGGSTGVPAIERFYRSRQRTTMVLLLFVVGIGLPVVSLQGVRLRLSSRVETFREAYHGRIHTILLAQVGENKEPFPEEYTLPEPPLPNYPKLPGINYASIEPAPSQGGARIRTLRIPAPSAETPAPQPSDRSESAPAEEPGPADANQPKFQQGVMEKEAYDLLLKLNAVMDRMVQGGDPTLKYKSWDATKREEGIFWVRITFASVADDSSVDYIWQVNLQSKQVTALSYNARALARS